MTPKEKYKLFCDTYPEIPIFFQPFWLDNVMSGGDWDVIMNTDSTDNINSFLVYYTTTKYGRKVINMPPITPFSGIIILNDGTIKVESKNKKIVSLTLNLLDQLPKNIIYYSQSYHYTFDNWLPFYWNQYVQTTRYSFVIDDLIKWSLDDVSPNIRNKISKASKLLHIEELENIDILYDLIKKSLTNKKLSLNITKNQLQNLDDQLQTRGQRLILGAKTDSGEICASIYVVFDSKSAYNLLLGSDPLLRQNGAVPFVIYHAILESSKRVKTFDFEGSMLESLFDIFSGFGGSLKPYYRIYKAKNIFWDITYRIKSYYDKSNR